RRWCCAEGTKMTQMDARPASAPEHAPPTSAEIIVFFDELLADGVDLPELLERASAFLGAPLGYAPAHGDAPGAGTPPPGDAVRLRIDSEHGEDRGEPSGELWIALADTQLATIALERLAVAVRVTLRWAARHEATTLRAIDVLID